MNTACLCFPFSTAAPAELLPAKSNACPAGLLALVLLLSLAIGAQAEDFTYTTNNGTITIIRYTGSGGEVIIPDTIDGLPVTTIGDYAFNSYLTLTSVSIPNTVTSVRYEAFHACANLTNVLMGAGVTNVGSGAFERCTGLPSVTLPESVVVIGDRAFYGCTNLASLLIGAGVTNIGPSAFSECASLASITLPDPVVALAGDTFARCTCLTNVTVGSGLATLEPKAFLGCINLRVITVSEANLVFRSVDGVVFNRSQAALVVCPPGRAGDYAIPNGVTSIADLAFPVCASLTNVTLPGSLTNIGNAAFGHCTWLAGVYCNGNAPAVSSSAFVGDNFTTVYYLPEATGWGPTLGGRPTALWRPQFQAGGADFGVRSNRFGCNVLWADGRAIVVEACTNLAAPAWSGVETNTLNGGSFYFSDPQFTNHPVRLYRLRSP